MNSATVIAGRERALQRLVTVYIVTGLLFMLGPGTFLGVWNLISISADKTVASLSPAWVQAHGHAQIFGWIGTFIIGIGFYSLSKMGRLPAFAVSRGWLAWALWTAGVGMRWAANIYQWHWRILLPLSAALELAGFLTFFRTVRGHKNAEAQPRVEIWMRLVIASSIGFGIALLLNAGAAAWLASRGDSPALPHAIHQRYLVLLAWGFLVPAVWGFNARWLPVFLGLAKPAGAGLLTALGLAAAAVVSSLSGFAGLAAALASIAAVTAIWSLHVFEPAERPAKTLGVHPSFPFFVRLAYVWLLVAAGLTMWAVTSDTSGGIWGASRHALTVGFLSTMVFAIGQRILPAFCGMHVLFSSRLMFASLVLVNLGCLLRVSSEIPAYEGYARGAWGVLPVSAVIEMTAFSLFAANLLITFLQRPAHEARMMDRPVQIEVR